MGGDHELDGGGLRIFLMGGDRPPWGGQRSDGGESPPSPPILDNPGQIGRQTGRQKAGFIRLVSRFKLVSIKPPSVKTINLLVSPHLN